MAEPASPPSDAALVERARRGERAAFEALVRRHYRTAYLTALGRLGQPADAEDVCQDAFLRALERLDDCRHPERFAAWLLQIVRNAASNYRQYLKVRTAAPLEEVNPGRDATAPAEARRGELREHLERALAELTAVQREVVLRHDLEGWSHKEIAAQLRMSEVSSRQHLFQARKALRSRLGSSALEEYAHD